MQKQLNNCFGKGLALALAMGMAPVSSHAAENKQVLEQKQQPFTVTLGATRVIYNADSSGATLSVSNAQDYPMLVKSVVLDADKKTPAPFIVTPPLFRLDGKQQSRLRIVRTGGVGVTDREKLQWLCVTGIPPKSDDTWAQGEKTQPDHASLNIQISVSSCIKLLVRPSSLRGEPADTASSLTWQREGKMLKVNNPTPFYMNLGSVSVGGNKVEKLTYVPPFGTASFAMPQGGGNEIAWTIITDIGGTSRTYKSAIQ